MKTINIPELATRRSMIGSRRERIATRRATVDAKGYEVVVFDESKDNLFCSPYFWYDIFYEDKCV